MAYLWTICISRNYKNTYKNIATGAKHNYVTSVVDCYKYISVVWVAELWHISTSVVPSFHGVFFLPFPSTFEINSTNVHDCYVSLLRMWISRVGLLFCFSFVHFPSRNLVKHQYAKLFEAQEEMCRKRNEIRIANMQLAVIKAQVRFVYSSIKLNWILLLWMLNGLKTKISTL